MTDLPAHGTSAPACSPHRASRIFACPRIGNDLGEPRTFQRYRRLVQEALNRAFSP
ncbi:hypothetical protein [Neoroseomonas lacus]|uniref:hypothetical protein n=1 Tax=Neoroseomonas lacus TaxID=287609 RepID=UPI00166359CC|nr:hypothetical protein [Neoroseomonas lacus]